MGLSRRLEDLVLVRRRMRARACTHASLRGCMQRVGSLTHIENGRGPRHAIGRPPLQVQTTLSQGFERRIAQLTIPTME